MVCRVGSRCVALPLEVVIETMRPLPVVGIPDAVPAVIGLATIRGAATAVIDVASLFDELTASPQRWVTIRTGDRTVALAVESVLGVKRIARTSMQTLPALLGDARTSLVDVIASADKELVLVLHAARIVPEELQAK